MDLKEAEEILHNRTLGIIGEKESLSVTKEDMIPLIEELGINIEEVTELSQKDTKLFISIGTSYDFLPEDIINGIWIKAFFLGVFYTKENIRELKEIIEGE